eukprot:gene7238-8046_t
MGGDYNNIYEENVDHRPYTSLRKLFYNFPTKSELSTLKKKKATIERQCKEKQTDVKASCKTICDIRRIGRSNNISGGITEMHRNRRLSFDLDLINSLSKSYSDLYFEDDELTADQMKKRELNSNKRISGCGGSSSNKLVKSKWMTRSEGNMLNLSDSHCCNESLSSVQRSQSYDISKLQPRDSIFSPIDELLNEEFEYLFDNFDDNDNDNDSDSDCQESPTEDCCWSIEENVTADKDISLRKSKSVEGTSSFRKSSSSSMRSHWSSFSENRRNGASLPWTKREQKTKRSKLQWKPRRKRGQRQRTMSSSFDQIRTFRKQQSCGGNVVEDRDVLLPRFDSENISAVMTNLLHSRRSLSGSSLHLVPCCDGVFGCS